MTTGEKASLVQSLLSIMQTAKPDRPAGGSPRASPTMPRRRLLLPKEHGAYAEIGFPLLTVLLLGTPDSAALLLSIAFVCAFLLHEPALVLLGHRGTRLKREVGGAAVRLASVLAGGGLGLGIAGLWLSPPDARWVTLVPLGLGIALLPMTLARREKTLAGELLAGAALITASVPVALAASVPTAATVVGSLVWGVSFGLGTLLVRSTVVSAKGGAQRLRAVTLLLALGTTLAALWLATTPALPAARGVAAVIPGSIATIGFMALRVPPRRLRTIGWTLAVSNVMTLLLLLVML